jgi:oxygen-independent coproporphyrinogen III oxidase
MLGLYLHVPFCSAICNYCNFNRGLLDEGLKARYVAALEREIAGHAARGRAADTIYFGGGTPSLLEPVEIARLIAACREHFAVPAGAEVTMEANPETVTSERLAAYRAAGVTRLSFGVQSFRDEELRRLSRLHGAARAREAVAEARSAGFDNVSLDLMMWLPGQRTGQWLESVDAAVELAPEHVSVYLLELYPNAPLREEMARGSWRQAPDEEATEMYLLAFDHLDRAGYEQYEISNAALPGRRSRHNLKYWQDGDWVGLGCGAHSTLDGVRWKNVAATDDYVVRVERGEAIGIDVRRLTPEERLGDALFTGLRLTDGVDLAGLQARYGVDVWRRYGADLQPFVNAGWLEHGGDGMRLTRPGMLVANEVMMVFV